MSRIGDLGEDLKALPLLINEYEETLEDIKLHVSIEGKTLVQANRENPVWHSYYDQKRIELNIVVKYVEAQVSKVRSELFKSLNNFSQRELSDNAKNKYIDSEPKYLNIYELYLEIKELNDKYEAACKAFQTRGYALNNITKVVVAETNDYII